MHLQNVSCLNPLERIEAIHSILFHFCLKKNDFGLLIRLLPSSKMSGVNNKAILSAIKSFLEGNEKPTKKDFLKAVGDAFDMNAKTVAKAKTLKVKAKAKKDEGLEETEPLKKTVKKDALKPEDDDEKPKRKLSAYQIFAKEQLTLLKSREDEKEEGVVKLKQKDLMRLVARRWKLKKDGVDESEWDSHIEEEDD